MADWYRLNLCEIYLQIISGNEKTAARDFTEELANSSEGSLHRVCAHSRANEARSRERQLDPSGQQVGSTHKALGLLYKVKKKHALALEHLTEAKRIFSQYGPSPALTRVETALVELQK